MEKNSYIECILMEDIHRVFELPHNFLTGGCMKEGEQGKGELDGRMANIVREKEVHIY